MPGHGKSEENRQCGSKIATFSADTQSGLTKHKENHERFGRNDPVQTACRQRIPSMTILHCTKPNDPVILQASDR
jgi:hypothetical protein